MGLIKKEPGTTVPIIGNPSKNEKKTEYKYILRMVFNKSTYIHLVPYLYDVQCCHFSRHLFLGVADHRDTMSEPMGHLQLIQNPFLAMSL